MPNESYDRVLAKKKEVLKELTADLEKKEAQLADLKTERDLREKYIERRGEAFLPIEISKPISNNDVLKVDTELEPIRKKVRMVGDFVKYIEDGRTAS